MKRPQKVELHPTDMFQALKDVAWNECCIAWEKFLPSEEELERIVMRNLNEPSDAPDVAKAILKRLEGKE